MNPIARKPSKNSNHWHRDGPASSALTQERLGWQPVQPGIIADLNAGHYFEHAADAVALHG